MRGASLSVLVSIEPFLAKRLNAKLRAVAWNSGSEGALALCCLKEA